MHTKQISRRGLMAAAGGVGALTLAQRGSVAAQESQASELKIAGYA